MKKATIQINNPWNSAIRPGSEGISGWAQVTSKMWTPRPGYVRNVIDRKYSDLTEGTSKETLKENGWHEINWRKAEAKMKDLQEKIVIATMEEDFRKVYNLQWKILQSFEARALAIRRIVTNKGGKTAGTDGIIWTGPGAYWDAIKELGEIVDNPNGYRAQPLKRVYIPKGNTKEMRPLGIPTMIDRAVQAIYHLGVDPVVETQSDPNSFGFRKHRSTHDAITAIRSLLDKKTHPTWILEADISKCFDRIDHKFLMEHTPIRHKAVLEQWLKSGVMEEMNYLETNEGTPQGGIISPTLCNVALNGVEDLMKKSNPLRKGISPGVHLIRYADDMIITGKSREIAIRNKEILAQFLAKRGLQLNEKKTVITHIREGFDFIGFNIRRMDWDPRLNQSTDQKTVLIIKPSKKGIQKLEENVKKVIIRHKPMEKIIAEMNPMLRGWGEHKRISYHSQETFITLDHWIYRKMLKWASWHKGSLRKTVAKYRISSETRKWNWGVSLTEKILNLGEIAIIKLRPLKLDRNPYLKENAEYFERRRAKLINAKFRASLYKKYKQTCPICGETLHNGEIVEIHHIFPRRAGGKYSLQNCLPLHQICHQQVTYGNQSLERLQIAISKPPKIERKKRTTSREDQTPSNAEAQE